MVCSNNAQNAAKNWVFGVKARIDFNGSSPAASTVPTIETNEGSASISDSNGNLLFYTDGIKVWNREHRQMPNGFGLTGNISSTQSALIVPCNCDKYFIFTTGAHENNFNGGFRYSVVNMAADGGFGDVQAKLKNTMLVVGASEKVAGVSDGNGGFWVVAHGIGDNRFYSYHIRAGSDCTLKTAPTISQVGSIYTNIQGVGQMKISPDGNRLAVALYGAGGSMELFRFDRNTGVVSDLANPTVSDTNTTGGLFYGVEFSPDSRALYFTMVHTSNTIYRYDISSNAFLNRTSIFGAGPGDYVLGALQLAPDGKIYVARDGRNFLNVVNSPNATDGGSVTQFDLAPGSNSGFGLLSMVAGEFSCGGTSSGCCDQVKQTPFWTPDLSLAWKAYEVYNVKYPATDICSIDIDIRSSTNAQPPNPWNGGGLKVNGLPRAVPAWWKSPYVKIPNGTNLQTVIDGHPNFSAAAVNFNLGLDYSGTYTGKVKFIIRHCDGTVCEWVSDNWTPSPPQLLRVKVKENYLSKLAAEYLPLVLGFDGEMKINGSAKWLAVEPLDEDTEVFSVDGGGGQTLDAEDADRPQFIVASAKKQDKAALYELAQTVNFERLRNGEIKLVLKRPPGNTAKPRLRFIFFDESANIIGFATNEDK
jgi:hypothetical protein